MKKGILQFLLLLFTLQGMAQLSQNGLLFDGIDDRVAISNNTAYNFGTGSFTVETWIRCDAASGANIYQNIVSQSVAANSIGFTLALSYSGLPVFSINGSGWGPGVTLNLRDGVCHHLAVVRKDSIITFYLDGAPLAGSSVLKTAVSTTNPLTIGGASVLPPNSSTPFKGLVKEVRLWNVARSNSELLTYMNTIPAGSATGLVGYWRMNATSGQTVTDLSNTANNGVLGSTAAVESLDPAFSTGCPSCTQTTAVISAGGPTTFCIGDSVGLNANTGAGFIWQWYRNGTAIAGANSSIYYAKLSGAYSAKLTNGTGCVSYSNAIDVVQRLDNAGVISCSGAVFNQWACLNGGNTRTLSTGTGSGYTYQWKNNGVNIGGAVSSTYTTGTAGVYTCVVTAGGCSRTTSSFTLGPNPVTLSATSSTQVCQGTVDFVATRTYGSASATYDWKLNGVSVGAPSYFGYSAATPGGYTCVVTDLSVCPGTLTSNTIYAQIGTVPSIYFSPNVNVLDDCSSSQVNFGAATSNGNPYMDAGLISIDLYKNGTYMETSMSPYFTAYESGVYSMFASTTCGATGTSTPLVIRMIQGLALPDISHGATTSCTQVALSVDNYWSSYQWYVNGAPIAGAVTSNHSAVLSGFYTCRLYNSCGSVMTNGVNVTINATNASISAVGGPTICNGANKTLQAVTGSGYAYQWKLNNVDILNATQSVYITATPGVYSCQVSSSCGPALSNAISLVAGTPTPATPGTITGTARPCPGTNNVNYSIAAVSGASTYAWVVPAGYSIVSGQGTTNLLVNVGAGFNSGAVTVTAGNACGMSAAATKNVFKNIPGKPAVIAGQTSGVCSSTKTYSVNAVNLATGYMWSVPAGAVINSGQGTTSITVTFNASFNTDTIKVYAFNSCGSSSERTLVVKGAPATPGAISGTVNVCAGQTGLIYSIVPVAGASNYTWTKPTGAVFTNGQGTTQITMTMGAVSGNIKVKANNACGSSINKLLALNVVCRENEIADIPTLQVYPNPAAGNFQIGLIGADDGLFDGEILNLTGQIISKFSMSGNDQIELGAEFPAGVYLLRISNGEQEMQSKLVKL